MHDQLVDVEHIDAASEVYYMQLELRVAAKFPGRLSKQQQRGVSRLPAPASTMAAQAFGRALRVNVKDALPGGSNDATSPSSMRPLHGFMNVYDSTSGDGTAAAAGGSGRSAVRALPAAAGRRKGGSGPQRLQQERTSDSDLYSGVRRSSASGPLPPSGSRQSSAASGPVGSGGSLLPGSRRQALGSTSLVKQIRLAADMPSYSSYEPLSYEQMQQEYMRQRAAVVEELGRAKALAEVDRARIMAKIGKALGASRWQS